MTENDSPLPSWVRLLPAFPGTLEQAAGLPLPSPHLAQTQEDDSRRLSFVTRSAVKQELMLQCGAQPVKPRRRVQPMPKHRPRSPLREINATSSARDKIVPPIKAIEAIYRPLSDKEAQYLIRYDKGDKSEWRGRSFVDKNYPREWQKFHKRARPDGSHPDEMFGIKTIVNHRGCNCNVACLCPSKQYDVLWEDGSRTWEPASGIQTSYDYPMSGQDHSAHLDCDEYPVRTYERNRRLNSARRI
ncbi:hypothetical protein DdX_12554 [Ditylenchus destructor]|uniref:Uncharacterized protein n=1 Tax=Ditylenchus destructor TaxID=166010 RepID=A0AAD4MXZ1_9BILA|nr:hypothetical protein DdX_12554 [Ditylenchus destructor]